MDDIQDVIKQLENNTSIKKDGVEAELIKMDLDSEIFCKKT